MRTLLRSALGAALVAGALLAPHPASADEPAVPPPPAAAEAGGGEDATAPSSDEAADDDRAEEREEAVHHTGLLAFRIVAGTSRAFPQNTWVFGFGVQAELDVAELFEVALGASALLGEQSTIFPIDLLLKKTFHLGQRVGFFAGLGPTLAIVTHPEDDPDVALGGTINAGFVLWHSRDFGVLVEATYQLIFEAEVVHDIEGAVGVAWGF